MKKGVQYQKGKKKYAPSERSLKKILVNSGYSGDMAGKIWKWYNPRESSGSKTMQ